MLAEILSDKSIDKICEVVMYGLVFLVVATIMGCFSSRD